jgi:alanine racemase
MPAEPSREAEDARLRPTYAVVSLSRLRDNLAAVKAHVAPARVMVALKAIAYGHGLEAVARCLALQDGVQEYKLPSTDSD